jgi:uncharacterized protein
MKTAALAILQFYKRWISPSLPPSCRYVPTCSEYAHEAIDRYGVLRGGVMAAWRLLRCHPFVKGGYDPVVKHAPASGSGVASLVSHNHCPDAGALTTGDDRPTTTDLLTTSY